MIKDYATGLYETLLMRINGRGVLIFLNNTHIPVPKEMFNTSMLKDYSIKWNATTNPATFTDSKHHELSYKHINYLGLSVSIPGQDILELTDWINDLKWSGSSEPTPSEIFTLWCCEKGSPLFYDTRLATVEIITEDGNIIKRGLNDFPRTLVYEDGADTREDTNRTMDAILSSCGR